MEEILQKNLFCKNECFTGAAAEFFIKVIRVVRLVAQMNYEDPIPMVESMGSETLGRKR